MRAEQPLDLGGVHVEATHHHDVLLAVDDADETTIVADDDVTGVQPSVGRAAETGHTDSMYTLGFLYARMMDPPDLDAGRHWLERAAADGDNEACYKLGALHAAWTTPPDLDAARAWYQRAADAGHADAMSCLGVLHLRSMDEPDLSAARPLFERAAEAGHRGAMTALGDLYAQVLQPPDLAAARLWYQRASAAGDRGAMHNLEVLYGEPGDNPSGWGTTPPDEAEMDAMVEWLDGPGALLETSFATADSSMDAIVAAFKRGDESAVRAIANEIARLIIDQLPPALPTPDPDLTRALRALIDDGVELRSTDRELVAPLTPRQRETLQSRSGDLAASLHAVATIFERDLDILEVADRY